MGNGKRYYKDVLDVRYYLLAALMLFFAVVIALSTRMHYATDPNKAVYVLMPVLYVALLYAFAASYYHKVVVDGDGNVSIPGTSTGEFEPNRYFTTYVSTDFHFSKGNIKRIELVPRSDVKLTDPLEGVHLAGSGEAVLIEFGTPLEWGGFQGMLGTAPQERPLIGRMYVSVGEPERLVRDLRP